MIGYAPFLGQVRLVRRPRLGQDEVPMRSRAEWIQMVGLVEGLVSARPECDPDGRMGSIMERLVTWLNGPPAEGEIFTLTDEEEAVQKNFNECIRSAPATVPVGAPAPSEGIPTWAWVVGGLAAVSLVAFLATR